MYKPTQQTGTYLDEIAYKPTQEIPLYQFTNRKNSPKDTYEMIKREVQLDDAQGYWKREEVKLPKYTKPEVKKNSTWWKMFFKNSVVYEFLHQ